MPVFPRVLLSAMALASSIFGAMSCAKTATSDTSSTTVEYPRVVAPGSTDVSSSYARSLQAAPDRYVIDIGSQAFGPSDGDGPIVDLVGAMHVGDVEYYSWVASRLAAADVVLFEGVTDGQDAVSQPDKPSPYRELALALETGYQLDHIDYGRPGFRRCDLSIGDMRGLLEAEVAQGGQIGKDAKEALDDFDDLVDLLKGESGWVRLALWMLGRSGDLQARIRFMLVLTAPDSRKSPELSPRLQRLLLDDRNAHVLEEIGHVLADSAGSKRIAVFYGAAHLAGLAHGLEHELGYRPIEPIAWSTALVSEPRREGLSEREINKIRRKSGS